MQFNKSTLDKYLRIAREYISRYISPLLSATKAIHPVVRNRMMNIAYAGIVALAFVLSLIKNNTLAQIDGIARVMLCGRTMNRKICILLSPNERADSICEYFTDCKPSRKDSAI